MARILEKDPDVDASYTFDWTNQLSTATITASTWTLPADLSEVSSSFTDTTTTIRVGGGTSGNTYEITDTISRTIGADIDATAYVYVKQQILDEVRKLPLTLSEIKHSLRVTSSDDDDYITELLAAAVQFVESSTGRDLISRTRTIRCRRFHREGFEIDATPTRAVARIRYYDTDNVLQTLDTSVYSVYEAPDGATFVERAINQEWPSTADRDDAVELLTVGGYGPTAETVPELAKTAIRMVVRDWYDNPDGNRPINTAVKAIIWNLKTGYYVDV